ncbi:MAG: TIGR02757 family protein [Chitinophagaceae bacterium]|nr:TIGR02757 family protein [Chitinophagaceae bacterium]
MALPPDQEKLRNFFDRKVLEYNRPSFIKDDPVCIPHAFSRKQDIEISGLFAAVFAWGNRTTIINKSNELMTLMDKAPYNFCLHHTAADLKKLAAFKHRTFNYTDLLYFIAFLRHHYERNDSLESAFLLAPAGQDHFIEQALIHFHVYFFSLDPVPARTRKHISTPWKGSTCKRLNMFLRWMVRSDNQGVDFGIWKKIRPAQLICPIDLHVARVAKRFGLLDRKQIDWQAAEELTAWLRTLDPADPVKYDFALFGLGVLEKY